MNRAQPSPTCGLTLSEDPDARDFHAFVSQIARLTLLAAETGVDPDLEEKIRTAFGRVGDDIFDRERVELQAEGLLPRDVCDELTDEDFLR